MPRVRSITAFFQGLLEKLKPRPLPFGRLAEKQAELHLKSNGYRLLARNLRNAIGEIDLLMIAPDGRTLVIVEVKAGRNPNGPPPERHITPAKQGKLTALAKGIIRRYRWQDKPARFDVVAVVWPLDQPRPTRLTHYPNAFEARW